MSAGGPVPSRSCAPTAAWRPWRGSRPWLDTEPGRRPARATGSACGRCGRWGGSRRPRDGPPLLCGRWRRYGWRRCRGWSGRRRSVVAEPAERVAQDRQHDDRHGHDVVDRASTHRLGPSSTAIISGMSSPASSASPDEAGEGFGELGGGHGCCPGAVPGQTALCHRRRPGASPRGGPWPVPMEPGRPRPCTGLLRALAANLAQAYIRGIVTHPAPSGERACMSEMLKPSVQPAHYGRAEGALVLFATRAEPAELPRVLAGTPPPPAPASSWPMAPGRLSQVSQREHPWSRCARRHA